jgi:tetratricopeptide (TPR) repeat protein
VRWRLAFVVLVAVYVLLLPAFTDHLKTRPVEVKLGYLPHPQVLKIASGEHRTTVSEIAILRVLFYFGTIIQKFQENVIIRPEFMNMFKMLQNSVYLDPYNMDAYYFAQASFTWELGRVDEVNELLKIGLEKRDWDPWIPFYLGFNYAYFLKDYEQAAGYMQRAAELSGNPLFTTLAARYFYESSQTPFGLAFLETMIKSAKNPALKIHYELRRNALLAVMAIEEAQKKYLDRFGSKVENLQQLVASGVLDSLPVDPYGGSFYLDDHGKVRTTSKFASSDQ